MQVSIYNQQKDLCIDKSSIRALVKKVLSFLKTSPKEVTLYFVTEEKISQLHTLYFQDPSPTDCISFPLDGEHLGEIFICPLAAIKYAKRHQKKVMDELHLYIIHGLLHLLGYDDLEPKQRKLMRKMEKQCMKQIEK